MADWQRGSGVRWYGPSLLGWTWLCFCGAVCLVALMMSLSFSTMPHREPSYVLGYVASVALLLAATLYARPFAVAVGVSGDGLLVRTVLGLRRLPWSSISEALFWTDPRVAAQHRLPVSGAFPKYVSGRPFAEGVTLTVPAHWTTGRYVAISETALRGGRAAIGEMCLAAGIAQPARHVLPAMTVLARSRGAQALHYLGLAFLAVYPPLRYSALGCSPLSEGTRSSQGVAVLVALVLLFGSLIVGHAGYLTQALRYGEDE